MKIISLTLAAIAACCSIAPAYAQQQEQAAANAESLQPLESVTVKARRFHLEPQEFVEYEFAYILNNGETVRFSRKVGRFFVTIKGTVAGAPAVEIFPTTKDHFVTKGGAQLTFTEDGDALTIDHYEQLQMASGVPIASVSKASK
jgi:hypothetical protein